MCKVEWCSNKPIWKGYCRNHYDQIRKYGNITNDRPRGQRNEYVSWILNDYAELHILNEDGSIKVKALIDKEDIDKLSKYSFRYDKDHYIKTFDKGITKYLHRIVMNYDGKLEIDHINRNKLDNRKCNLRIVDRKTNANNLNKRETYGIINTKRKLVKPYKVQIKDAFYGYYSTYAEAKKVRDNLLI